MNQSNRKSRRAQEIDDNLRRAFDDISNQELPDRFAELLASLKDAETISDGDPSNDK